MAETVRTERHGPVLAVVLNRPERLNALDPPTMIRLRETLQAAATDPTLRGVLLTGAGSAFCAGGDVQEMDRAREEGRLGPLFHVLTGEQETVVRDLMTMPKPVVAALPGVAAGGGLSIALACDWRIASESATLVPAFPQLGAIPDGGLTYLLPHFLGIGLAQRLLFSEVRVPAAHALELGLVHEVVEPTALESRAWSRVEELANGPTFAYSHMKRLMVSAFSVSLESQMALERRAMVEAAAHSELPEGIRAFREKRTPRFHSD